MGATAQRRNSRLVLIFGMPRSGTTWLGKIFDSHPDTVYRHEPDTYPRLRDLPRFPPAADAYAYRESITEFVAELPRMRSARVVAKLPLFSKSYRSRSQQYVHEASALATKLGERVHVRLPIVGAKVDRLEPSPVIVWKSIESMGRYGMLIRAIPEARGIHLIRHPCGQIGSVLRGEKQSEFHDKRPSSEYYDLFNDLIESPPARRRGLALEDMLRATPEERLAWLWVITNEKAVEDAGGLDRTRLIRYEDLCSSPEETVHSLLEFAGLGWNRQTESFLHDSTHAPRDAYYSVYKAPSQSAQRWHQELEPGIVDRILGVLSQSTLASLYKMPRDSRACAATTS